MPSLLRLSAFLVALTASQIGLAAPDALMAAFEESKSSGKGLNFYVNGQAVAGVVVSIDDRYVIARSQAQGKIVIRLDRIDGVAGFVTLPQGEKR